MKDLKDTKIGFIGFGNMGSAIAEGLLKSGAVQPSQLYACAGRFEKLQDRCAAMGGVQACRSAAELADAAELIFVAVKPGKVQEVLTPILSKLAGKLLVTVTWGLYFDSYEALLPKETHVLCTIPNTPVAVGKGIFVTESRHSLTDEEYAFVTGLLSKVGLVVPVETEKLGIAGTIAGCGPAYAAMFTEAMADAGVLRGLPRQTAYQLVSGMLQGTAALQLSTGTIPATMKDAVCSPGGSTIKGVAVLEEKGFRGAVIDAILAVK